MRILVTGGGGFLGSHIVKELLTEGHEITIFNRSKNDHLKSLGVEISQGDLLDKNLLKVVCRNKDAVFHVAAKAGVWGSRQSYFDVNVLGTKNILSACKHSGVKYFIYTSTPSVVFNRGSFKGQNESLPYGSRWLCSYAESKAIAEKEVLSFECDSIKICALRPHLIFGPGDPHLLPRIISAAKLGKIKLVGNGENKVDVTYVKDAARAHALALNALISGKANRKAYFISQGEPVNLWNWINHILTKLNIPIIKKKISLNLAYNLGGIFEFIWRIFYIKGEPPMTRFVAFELAHDHYFNIDNAKNDIGYEPKYKMEDAISETISSYL